MLTLLSLLQNGRAWGGAELATRLEISRRTLRRDIDELRQLGYPVRTRPGPGGHYHLVAGTAMPPLLLDDDEAVAVAVGLRMASHAGGAGNQDDQVDHDEAASRALSKLEQVLPRRLSHRVSAIHLTTETSPPDSPSVPTGLLGLISTAAHRGERLSFSYPIDSETTMTRLVEPYRQVFTRNRWYLLAWDLDRGDWRTFRLDRLRNASPTGQHFAPRPLPAPSAVAYLDAARKARSHRVVMTFQAPVDQLATRLRHQDAELTPLDEKSCRLITWVDSFEWLAASTLVLGIDFAVQEPVGFTDYCLQLRDRLDRAT